MKKEKPTLQPLIQHMISEEFKKLKDEKITPWVFFNTGKMPVITNFYGKSIHYQGVEFEGSPRLVFWDGFIEPFLKDIIVRSIQSVVNLSKENGVATEDVLLHAKRQLSSGIWSIYHEMQNIDQRIKGKGFPERANKRDISGKIKRMEKFLEDHVNSAIEISKKRFSINKLYREHPFWFWLIGAIIAVISITVV